MLRSPRVPTKIRGGRRNPKENQYYHPPYNGDLETFKVYLNSREYFTTNFPKLIRYRWRDSDACNETNNDGIVDDKSFENTIMFQTMAATWVATWMCGISREDMKKPGIVGAIYRFHVYFTVRRILRLRGQLAFYIQDINVKNNVWKYLPTMYELYDYGMSRVCKLVEITDKDYIYMVAPTSKGLTRLGVSPLQESAMTYVYALLTSQAVNPGKKIIGDTGIAQMIQKSFIEKVEDRIRADNGVDNLLDLYERTLTHSTATGIIKISEGVIEIPSNLVIETKKVVVNPPVKTVINSPVKTKTLEVVDIKPLKSAMPVAVGVGVGMLVLKKLFL